MKVFRIDTLDGHYKDVATTEEVKNYYSEVNFTKDEKWEIPYNVIQLERARLLYRDVEWCLDYEEEHGIQPDVYDILKHLYGGH